MKHVPVLCNVIGWVFIYLALLAEAEFQDESGSIIKIPGEYRIHSNPIKKTKTSSEKYKNSHNKRERQTLLREFVLGDFTPYVQDTSDDEKNSYAEIHYGDKTFVGNNKKVKDYSGETFGIFTNDEINTRKTNNKIHKLLKGITARLKSNQVDLHKTNEKDKVHNKKSKYSHRRKWKERRFEHNIKHHLKGNLFDINLKKNKNSNNHRAEDDKTFPLKFKKTSVSKSGFPYGYYDNFASEYNNLPDNFDIYDKTYNYFLPDENSYDRNLKYRVDDRTWHKNKNGGASQNKLQEPPKKLPRNLNGKLYESLETSAYNPLKQIRIGNAIISDQYKNKANRYVEAKIHTNKLESKFRNEDGILKKSYRENSIKVQNNYDIDGRKRDKTERLATKDYHRGNEVINYKNVSAIKCNGDCSTAKVFGGSENNGSQIEVPCNEHERCKYGNNGSLINSETNENVLNESRKHQRKFYTLLKNAMEGRHKVKRTETTTKKTVKKGDVSLHNTISHSHNRNGKLALKPTSFAKKLKAQKKKKNNKKEDNSLLQQMLNIPVKLIVSFVRNYILGNKDPGDMVLKDVWQLPKSRLNKHSNKRSKTDLKISNIKQKKTKNNYKISFKKGNLKTILRNRHKSKTSTRTFKRKATKEANAVTRTLLSNEHKSALKGSKSFIELINVLIDGRLLHKDKYLNDVYKKSFLPKTEESGYSSEKNLFQNSELINKKQVLPKKRKLIHDPYFIPITRNAGNRPDWKNKNNILPKKAPSDFNVKRSDIYFPDGLSAYNNDVESLPRLPETLSARQSIQPFDVHSLDNNMFQDNQYETKYQHFYDTRDMLSFQYPWNNVGNNISSQYTIPKSNEKKSYSDLNTRRKTQKQYYKPILTLQETTHKPPPYTFQIYDGIQAPKKTSWNQIKSIKDESKHGLKYKGIFGNNDEDLQRSCIDVGKQDFKFSTQTLSVVMVCSFLLYGISLVDVYLASLLLDKLNNHSSDFALVKRSVKVLRDLVGLVLAAAIFAVILCVISLIRFLENHKNNMLRMFKGDKSFIPRTISVSQFMIGKGLRYHSFQIGYFLWGYVLLSILFSVIFIFFYSLSIRIVQNLVVGWLKGGGVLLAVALLTYLCLLIIAATIFRDYDFPKNVISINNRNVYLVFSYFWFFVGLPMGVFSAISRILRTMVVGALMLPRIDHSVMPDGFQRFDRGFNAYICYLHVQTAYRSPVLRVFCQILSDETRHNRERKWTCSAQARARWFLALTLARNPQLASNRKPGGVEALKAPQPVQGGCVKHGDVKIEVGRYGLIQDK
ncbi:Hypothetical predicted protein [Paramuricea clavata]|uniref:Uncharacterized protein n=1 Tax=Paramuricea clavata TaxID=317549 RepID=A0A7D9HFM2_PARCT|nr:Hypothetical predicted protein [Paramuricea clavata]